MTRPVFGQPVPEVEPLTEAERKLLADLINAPGPDDAQIIISDVDVSRDVVCRMINAGYVVCPHPVIPHQFQLLSGSWRWGYELKITDLGRRAWQVGRWVTSV